MDIKGIFRTICIGILLIFSLATPVLIATMPTSNAIAQPQAETNIEQATQSQGVLNALLPRCTINLTADPASEQGTVVGCVQDIVGILFIIALLYIIISLAASMLGTTITGGEQKGAEPITQARKKIENGIIGLVLIGGPFLLLSLFGTNFGNVESLQSKLKPEFVSACYELRKTWESQGGVINSVNERRLAGILNEKIYPHMNPGGQPGNNEKVTTLTDGSLPLYILNQRYGISQSCIGKIGIARYKEAIKISTGLQVSKNNILRAQLAGVIAVPTGKTYQDAKGGVDNLERDCNEAFNTELSFFCALSASAGFLVDYKPDSSIPASVVERNRWTIFLGSLYSAAYPSSVVGNSIVDALIVSVYQGKGDVASINTSLSVIKTSLIQAEYANKGQDPTVAALHSGRLEIAAGAVMSLVPALMSNEALSEETGRGLLSSLVEFGSTFLQSSSTDKLEQSRFVQLKATVVSYLMDILSDSDLTERELVVKSFRTLSEALRIQGNNVESQVLVAVSSVGDKLMQRLEDQSAGTYKLDEYDWLGAGIELGIFLLDIAQTNTPGQFFDSRAANMVRVSAKFGQDVVSTESKCAQKLFGIRTTLDDLITSRGIATNSPDEPARNTYLSRYNAKMIELATRYNALSTSTNTGTQLGFSAIERRQKISILQIAPILDEGTSLEVTIGEVGEKETDLQLLQFISQPDLVRLGLSECGGIKNPQIAQFTFKFMRVALEGVVPGVALDILGFAEAISGIAGLEYDDSIKQDYLALEFFDLARTMMKYIPQDTPGAAIATKIVQNGMDLGEKYINASIECKQLLEARKDQPNPENIDWEGIYTRYTKGLTTEDDKKILKTLDIKPCFIGVKTSVIVSAMLGTIKDIYNLAATPPNENISQLIELGSKFIFDLVAKIENNERVFPQAVAISVLEIIGFVISSQISSTDTTTQDWVTRITEAVIGQPNGLLQKSMDKQLLCEKDKETPPATPNNNCKGLSEFDFARLFLGILQDAVVLEGPQGVLFRSVTNQVSTWLTELERGGISGTSFGIGLVNIASATSSALFAFYANDPNITPEQKTNLNKYKSISGKALNITKSQLARRAICDSRLSDIKKSIVDRTIVEEQLTKIENLVGRTLLVRVSGSTFAGPSANYIPTTPAFLQFSTEDITKIEPQIRECRATVEYEVLSASVDLLAEFVKIPGFPMQEASNLIRYIVDGGYCDGLVSNLSAKEKQAECDSQYSGYVTAKLGVKLIASLVQLNACTPKSGETFSEEQKNGCAVAADAFEWLERMIQLYIEDKATDANFARELFYLGKNIALTLGADPKIVTRVAALAEKLVTLWEKSRTELAQSKLGTSSQIFNEKTVVAELLNFMGGLLPIVLKTDTYVGELIRAWASVAANALTTPNLIDTQAAIKATAAFVISSRWDCRDVSATSGKSANAIEDCKNNIGADMATFMGVLGAINIGDVPKSSYIDMCQNSVGEDICGPEIQKQITTLKNGIRSNKKSALRQSNSFLAENISGRSDLKVQKTSLGVASFEFSANQKAVLEQKITVCDVGDIPDNDSDTKTEKSARLNDPLLKKINDQPLGTVSSNPCHRNPMIQLTAGLSINLDLMIDAIINGLTSPYGSITLGQDKIVLVAAKVIKEIDFNRVAVGDVSTIGRTLVRNIGYVLKSIPAETLGGQSAATLVGVVADLPWETIIYNPLALGGPECAPQPKPSQTINPTTPGAAEAVWQEYKRKKGVLYEDYFISSNQPTAPTTAQKAAAEDASFNTGVDTASGQAGLTPACTASLVTGILARIDFTIIFSVAASCEGSSKPINQTDSLGIGKSVCDTAKGIGGTINTIIDIVDRMDFRCPLGTLKNTTNGEFQCDMSFGSVAKNIIGILSVVDTKYILGEKTSTFIKKFVANFPMDVFSTGFSLSQMDKWVMVTTIVLEELGVSQTVTTQIKQTYNDIVGVLKAVSQFIKDLGEIVKVVEDIVVLLGKLFAVLGPAIGKDLFDSITKVFDKAIELLRSFRLLLVEIRKVTDQFTQLNQIQLPSSSSRAAWVMPVRWTEVATNSTTFHLVTS